MTTDPRFDEKFDDFRVEVIDRLARIETMHTTSNDRMERFGTWLQRHEDELKRHSGEISKAKGAAGIIGAGFGMAAGALYHWITGSKR